MANYAGAPQDKLTIARAGVNATRYNASDIIEAVAADILRRDHDPRLGGVFGYLIEGARINRSIQTADWATTGSGDSSGTGSNPVVTADHAVAPDGTLVADRVELDKGAGVGFSRRQKVLSGLTSGAYAGSAFLKTNDGLNKQVALRIGSSGAAKPVTGSWKRYFQGSGGATTAPSVQVMLWDTLSTDQVADVAVWGSQCELADFASSPIITGAAAATRNADSVTLPTSEFPWSATEGTILFEGHTALGAGTQVLCQIDDGSEDNRFRLERDSSNHMRFIVTVAGVEECNLDLGVAPNDTPFKVAVAWETADFHGSLNGMDEVTASSGSLPIVDTLRFGASFTGEHFFGHLMQFLCIPSNSGSDVETMAAPSIAANDARIEDSDFAATLTKTAHSVSGVRPFSSGDYQHANPGWRRRFKTAAKAVFLHMENLDLVSGSFNGKGAIYVDGAFYQEFSTTQTAEHFAVRVDFPTAAQRTIEVVMPYSASIAFRGVSVPGGTIAAPATRHTLPRAVFLGDSRVQGFSATRIDKTWPELLCIAKGWQHINLGIGSARIDANFGTMLGNADPDVAFCLLDFNNRTDQTALATFKTSYKSLITNMRAIKPGIKFYLIQSPWISAANDALTLTMADYRQAEEDALDELADANNILIDGLALATNSTASFPDGIHPNDAGMAEIAAAMAGLVSL